MLTSFEAMTSNARRSCIQIAGQPPRALRQLASRLGKNWHIAYFDGKWVLFAPIDEINYFVVTGGNTRRAKGPFQVALWNGNRRGNAVDIDSRDAIIGVCKHMCPSFSADE